MQICAKADAAYDQAKGRIFISLDASARLVPPQTHEPLTPPAWLPAPEHVTEDLPRDQAADFAKAVFLEWVRKVRASLPAVSHAA